MNKKLLLFLFSVLSFFKTIAQDSIIKRTGEELKGKVTEISNSEIRYRKPENPDVIYSLPLSAIFMIKYENGTKEVFEAIPPAPGQNVLDQLPTSNPVTAKKVNEHEEFDNLYSRGKQDAQVYYKDYKTAGTVTFITTLVFPPVGLVTAIGTSASTPVKQNLDYPDAHLFAQPEYARGYTQKSRKIKSGKVWKNFGVGFGSLFLLSMIINSARL